MNVTTIKGRPVTQGHARGPAMIGETLQGNGALDFKTGEIIQEGHSLKGKSLKGSVLVISGAQGSTAWSVRLHTTLVNGVGPVAMVFPKMDARTAGAVAAMKLPAVTDLEQDIFAVAKVGDLIEVDGDQGIVTIIQAE